MRNELIRHRKGGVITAEKTVIIAAHFRRHSRDHYLNICSSKRLQMQVCIASAMPDNFTLRPAIEGMHSISGQKQFDVVPFRYASFGDKQPKGELVL